MHDCALGFSAVTSFSGVKTSMFQLFACGTCMWCMQGEIHAVTDGMFGSEPGLDVIPVDHSAAAMEHLPRRRRGHKGPSSQADKVLDLCAPPLFFPSSSACVLSWWSRGQRNWAVMQAPPRQVSGDIAPAAGSSAFSSSNSDAIKQRILGDTSKLQQRARCLLYTSPSPRD